MDPAVRWVLLARLGGAVVLAAIYVLWARSLPEFAAHTAWGLGVYLVATIVLVPAALRLRDRGSMSFWLAVTVADGIALGILTAGLGGLEDPFFAWYVGDAAVLAMVMRRRQSWVLTGLLVISYTLAHLIGHPVTEPMMHGFLIFKVATLLLVGGAVGITMGAQEERRVALESHQAETMELYAKLERSVSELRAVTEITEIIHSTLDVESVGPVLLEILHKVIDVPASCIYVIDKTKHETIFSASRGVPKESVRGLSGLEITGAIAPSASDNAFGCIELIDHPETLVVFCADSEAIDRLSPDDRIVLQTVASELVVAVENSRLYKLTKRLAITDELTDLYNYRYLQQRLDEEIGRADRYDKRLSLLMLDIDDFKRVNDSHGHRVGDGVLAEVGHVLKTTVREVDVVARYGGEEFSVVLPETDASGAFIVAEKIREAISLTRFKDADGERRIHVTVSIGLASYPVHAHDKESLLRAADDAVYRAKETGKNRVRAPRLRLGRVQVESTEQEVAE